MAWRRGVFVRTGAFKVSKLKIDQSFVRHVVSDPDDQALVATIISLARNLGLQHALA